jgi:hypothetical protein
VTAKTKAERDEEYVQRYMRRCKHFTGIMDDVCEAGVRYDDVRETSTRPYRLPCLDPELPCGARALPTRSEAEADRAETDASFERIRKALAAIREAAGGRRGVGGTIACPNCGGRLGYSIAGSNGHVHARCETPRCVSFMQ